jgi:cobalamin biosynthesis Co2+ chelatase CbiK
LDTGVSQVRERTQETWDKLEQVFENRVSRALGKLGIPGRKELDDVIRRVEELNREVRRIDLGKPAANLSRSFSSSIRRAKDDLSDLVKDIEDVQLAARQSAMRTIAKVTKAPSKANKPEAKPAGKPAAKPAPKPAKKQKR